MDDLGKTLLAARERKCMTLRDVERRIGVSNAYLSQLENGKIRAPSPTVLHKLASLFEVPYAALMQQAGYPIAEPNGMSAETAGLAARLGPVSSDEQDALAEYLAFLRSRTSRPRQ